MSFEQKWGISLDRAATQLDDQLRVVHKGRVVCCIALTASFYVAEGHTPEVRERIVSVFESYRKAVGDKLIWGGDPKTSRPKKVQGTAILDVRSWMPRVGPHDDFGPAFQGGQRKDDASEYTFTVLARTYIPGELSSVQYSLPLSWPISKPQGAYTNLIREHTKLLQPAHGYAGLGISLSVMENGTGEDMAFAVPIAKRFRGLELDFAHSQSHELTDGIKGSNWFTVLNDDWVERLGGSEQLSQILGADIPIHKYKGGIIIQAGPHPKFGDVNRNEPMEHYERVARAVKPIRVQKLGSIAPSHGLDKEQTLQYLARFDT